MHLVVHVPDGGRDNGDGDGVVDRTLAMETGSHSSVASDLENLSIATSFSCSKEWEKEVDDGRCIICEEEARQRAARVLAYVFDLRLDGSSDPEEGGHHQPLLTTAKHELTRAIRMRIDDLLGPQEGPPMTPLAIAERELAKAVHRNHYRIGDAGSCATGCVNYWREEVVAERGRDLQDQEREGVHHDPVHHPVQAGTGEPLSLPDLTVS